MTTARLEPFSLMHDLSKCREITFALGRILQNAISPPAPWSDAINKFMPNWEVSHIPRVLTKE